MANSAKVRNHVFFLCEGRSIEDLGNWKRRGNQLVSESCPTVRLFNEIIDVHIEALQSGADPYMLYQEKKHPTIS